MTAAEKHKLITDGLATGATVYVVTMTRTTEVTARFAAKWEKDLPARPLFKVAGNSLWISSGKRYLCIDFCAIKVGSVVLS